jgi:hypothetical protein
MVFLWKPWEWTRKSWILANKDSLSVLKDASICWVDDGPLKLQAIEKRASIFHRILTHKFCLHVDLTAVPVEREIEYRQKYSFINLIYPWRKGKLTCSFESILLFLWVSSHCKKFGAYPLFSVARFSQKLGSFNIEWKYVFEWPPQKGAYARNECHPITITFCWYSRVSEIAWRGRTSRDQNNWEESWDWNGWTYESFAFAIVFESIPINVNGILPLN